MASKNKKFIYGIFDDADAVMQSVVKLRAQGVDIHDCYTPFPVHGLDRAMGIKRSNLTIGAFIFGALGCLTAIVFQLYVMVGDWPMIIGGKPNDAYYPSFIPVTFELTILFTAFGMGILFFIRTKMVHGKVEDLVDLRQTDDLFVVAIEEKSNHFDKEAVNRTLVAEGALEIREREYTK
ncbi:MAG: DUF3341 domain-containing protein [Bacteroidota bacterium]|nr:DUF3341 domain-containing protein [Bacteroidota bacterium]MDX5429921.1 DUF3341 domain-containing protein [Bacteroidota bacterium]MDX5468695.1 DUF3341 domain-containing protein [Bacteroidota bacterium]